MKRKNWLVFLSLAVLLLAGCALISPIPTPYGPYGNTGGYGETKIQDNVFKVAFSGNAYTSSGQVENFALLRSAEVTIENGYRYFVIVDRGTETQTDTKVWSSPDFVFGGKETHSRTDHKPRAWLTIQCFKEKPENSSTIIYDAGQVRDNIKTQYRLAGVFRPGSEPDGFGDIKWGTDISTLSTMEYIKDLSGDRISVYAKKDDKITIGRKEPFVEAGILYFFCDGKFSGGVIATKGSLNYAKLKMCGAMSSDKRTDHP